jgi:dimethylamine/trimethylamine dehydrogenase
MPNVSIYRQSTMGAEDVLAFGADHVILATGCHWRRDGYGRSNAAIAGFDRHPPFTPDDVMDGEMPPGHVLLFDDDGFYHGSVVAEALRAAGRPVTFVTPAGAPAPWTINTMEFAYIQARLRELDVTIVPSHKLVGFDGERAELRDVWSDRAMELACDSVLSVTARLPNDGLYQDLVAREAEWSAAGTATVRCIGDALAPGAIVHAVHEGHRYARELGEAATGDGPAFRRELPVKSCP